MSFNTNIPGHMLLGDEDIIFGTAMLGTEYGEIISCSLTRPGSEIEIENNRGGLRAVILANPHFELQLEATFDQQVEPPAMGESIVFPYAGVIGRVMPGAEITWSNRGSRMLKFTAKHWDSMATETSPGSGVLENRATLVDAAGVATPMP
jgi:hypothetical protein